MNLDDLYSKAAKGDVVSQYDLGMLFIKGEQVAQDYAEGAHWLHQAGKQGSSDAQFVLGALFQKGLGVDQNPELAVRWYRSAAEGDHAEAQFNLGYCYEVGEGVEQDLDSAVKWYGLAAEQGDQDAADALRELGVEPAKEQETPEPETPVAAPEEAPKEEPPLAAQAVATESIQPVAAVEAVQPVEAFAPSEKTEPVPPANPPAVVEAATADSLEVSVQTEPEPAAAEELPKHEESVAVADVEAAISPAAEPLVESPPAVEPATSDVSAAAEDQPAQSPPEALGSGVVVEEVEPVASDEVSESASGEAVPAAEAAKDTLSSDAGETAPESIPHGLWF